jgi:hypothetical protein
MALTAAVATQFCERQWAAPPLLSLAVRAGDLFPIRNYLHQELSWLEPDISKVSISTSMPLNAGANSP